MNSKTIGTIGLGSAIEYFTRLGLIVSIPLNDSQSHDLIVDMGGKLVKVDVKYSTSVKNKHHSVELRKHGGNRRFNWSKDFDKEAVDFLFIVLSNKKRFLIPTSELDNKTSISPELKYKSFKYAKTATMASCSKL